MPMTTLDIEPIATALIMSNDDPSFCAGVYALATALGCNLDHRLSGWLYRWPMDRPQPSHPIAATVGK